jgi:cytoskeletal protein CcmA (bactofilin family)
VLALVMLGGFGVLVVRKRFRRGSALALVLTGLCAAFASPPPAMATEFRKGQSVVISKGETVKEDLFATGAQVRIEGTVDGDLFASGQEVTIHGHVTGDVFSFAQTTRIEGQVDGNVRTWTNSLSISGTVERSVIAGCQTFNLDPSGRIGRSLTIFSQTIAVDGKLDRDLLSFGQSLSIDGTVGGSIRARGRSMTVGSQAVVNGEAKFEGEREPSVSSAAKLGSPVQFTHHVKEKTEFGKNSVVWALLLAAAFVLFGLVLFLVMPNFSQEAMHSAESYGAAMGLGALVLFAVPIASLIACVTFVGLFVGLSTFVLWVIALYAAQTVVGALIGQWILGRTTDLWGRIGRMALGVLIIRAVTLVPHGGWLKLIVLLWGIGAISLALYRRFQPPAAPQPAYVPPGGPMTPLTPAGGAPAI